MRGGDVTSIAEFEVEVFDRISTILMVLSDVTAGEYDHRLDVGDLPENHPLHPLMCGINEMVESLARAQQRARVYQAELEEKLTTIERQREAIRDLSTPVIEVWDSVLCLPIIGLIDTTRSLEMTEGLLRAVVEKRARYAIIDITGIEVMDTRTADHFIRMAKAVQLLGAECVLTGVSPGIARTIVAMGIDLGGLATHRSLRNALYRYVQGQWLDRAAAERERHDGEGRDTWKTVREGSSFLTR